MNASTFTRAVQRLAPSQNARSACSAVSALPSASASTQYAVRRCLHVSAVVRKGEGPIEAKVRDEQLTIAAEAVRSFDASTLSGGIPPKVDEIADLICALNLVEAMQLSEALKKKLGVPESFFGGAPTGAVGPAAPSASEAAPAAAAAPAPAAKEEKLTVDIRLKSFKPDVKIKVIKEVRALTNLGLKEAKELVESAPCTIMAKVKKEEAAKIVAKLGVDVPGVELEMI